MEPQGALFPSLATPDGLVCQTRVPLDVYSATRSLPVSATTTLPAMPAVSVVELVGTISIPEGYMAACPGPPRVAT